MTKITLNDIASLTDEQTAIASINANSLAIETASDNFLSRDGTSPNQMEDNLDMNSKRIINLPTPVSTTEPLRLADLNSFIGGGTVQAIPSGGTSGTYLGKNSSTDYDVSWLAFSTLFASPYAIGGTTPSTGAFSTLSASTSITASVTNPTTSYSFPAFAYPSTLSAPVVLGLTATWQTGATNNSATLSVQSIAATTAPASGAPSAISAGTLIRRDGLDGSGILGYINNSTEVTLSNGAAHWALVRGYINGGSGSSTGDTSDAFRATSETDSVAANNPRAGLYVYQSTATNGFLKGVFISGAKDYGVRVGEGTVATNVIEPTTPFAWVRTDGTTPWSINKTGQVVSTLVTGTAPFIVASTTLVSNLHAAQADVAPISGLTGAGTGVLTALAATATGTGGPALTDSPVFTTQITSPKLLSGSNQVVGARVTGYTAMTGTPDKVTAYATSTVTLAQLAGRVAQLQADLTTHGLIGT